MSSKQKRTPGLVKCGEIWHIDKVIRGHRIHESTGTSYLPEAERYLAKRIEELRQAKVYGVRPSRTFRQAATKYLLECRKASIKDDAQRLNALMPYIGDFPIETIHKSSLNAFISDKKREGTKTGTINHHLKVVRQLLNLAASEWVDEYGLSWLASAPKIKLLQELDSRKPYPLSWEEQRSLFSQLPVHLARMALFKVNTGCRESEVTHLRWEWEAKVPELASSIFIIPAYRVKNRHDRVVVLNRTAKSIIDSVRGEHPEFVFTYKGRPVTRMNNSGWKRARKAAALPMARVHDLKHTFGKRLRAAGVSFEDRQDLLGHQSARITTHYSAAELANLVNAANKVCTGASPEIHQVVSERLPEIA